MRAVIRLAHREQHDTFAGTEQLLERERYRDRAAFTRHLGHHAVHYEHSVAQYEYTTIHNSGETLREVPPSYYMAMMLVLFE